MCTTFTNQPELSKAAESFAAECVQFMASQFQITLDGSVESVAAIEHCIGVLHDQITDHPLAEE